MCNECNPYEDQIIEAMVIMYRSIKIGRPLFEFKRWDQLDYDAKRIALAQLSWIKSAVRNKVSFEQAFAEEKTALEMAKEWARHNA